MGGQWSHPNTLFPCSDWNFHLQMICVTRSWDLLTQQITLSLEQATWCSLHVSSIFCGCYYVIPAMVISCLLYVCHAIALLRATPSNSPVLLSWTFLRCLWDGSCTVALFFWFLQIFLKSAVWFGAFSWLLPDTGLRYLSRVVKLQGKLSASAESLPCGAKRTCTAQDIDFAFKSDTHTKKS